jgi:hypothetical protein
MEFEKLEKNYGSWFSETPQEHAAYLNLDAISFQYFPFPEKEKLL